MGLGFHPAVQNAFFKEGLKWPLKEDSCGRKKEDSSKGLGFHPTMQKVFFEGGLVWTLIEDLFDRCYKTLSSCFQRCTHELKSYREVMLSNRC